METRAAPAAGDESPGIADGGWRQSFRALNATQFLGAFNDNLFKQAIILLAAGTASDEFLGGADAFRVFGLNPEALAGALFSAAFILFGAFAGGLADKYSKSRMMLWLKVSELALMLTGALIFWLGEPLAILGLLFLMGTQSAFFGPNKYGSLPEILPERQLSHGNAHVQMATYVAIIGGIWAGGEFLGVLERRAAFGALWTLGIACSVVSLVGVFTATRIRPLPAADSVRHAPLNPVSALVRDLRRAAEDRELLIGLALGALFLFAGGIVMFAAVRYCKDLLELGTAETSRVIVMLAIGIGLGSLVSGRLSGERIEPGLVPIGALGVTASLAALATPGLGAIGAGALLLVAGGAAGFFVVPVRAIVQFRPGATEKGRMMGLAQVLDFGALIVASILHDILYDRCGLGADHEMLAIGLIVGALALALFSRSELYFSGTRRILGLQRDARPDR